MVTSFIRPVNDLGSGGVVQLTYFSDYAMRLVLYLAMHQDRLVSIQEVSRAYGVSSHHMVKVVKRLIAHGLVASVRGRRGGLRLNRPPDQIRIGELVRLTEPHLDIVECFDEARNTCPIEPACGLKGVLGEARDAFMRVLDERTVADFLPRAEALIQLWNPALTAERV
jgi:Rrf2 family transcriptional regulator, nitric oxide-sensitive transcriptional repressor